MSREERQNLELCKRLSQEGKKKVKEGGPGIVLLPISAVRIRVAGSKREKEEKKSSSMKDRARFERKRFRAHLSNL